VKLLHVANIIVQSSSAHLDRVFDYLVPEELTCKATIGSRVIVPFGNRKIEGYIIGISSKTDIPIEKMKYIKELVDDEKIFDEKAIKLQAG
jgi:primosomal protein N' (replication factor Y)